MAVPGRGGLPGAEEEIWTEGGGGTWKRRASWCISRRISVMSCAEGGEEGRGGERGGARERDRGREEVEEGWGEGGW